MAKRKFTHFVPRPKPRKRPRRHKKNLNKHEARDFKKYHRQGRWKDQNFYSNGEMIDFRLPQDFRPSQGRGSCGNCGQSAISIRL